MMPTNATAKMPRARRIGLGLTAVLVVAAGAYWYLGMPRGGAQDLRETQSASPVAAPKPVSYPAPGKEPTVRTEFPAGAAPISGDEIVAALSDHTALLPGGFVEYRILRAGRQAARNGGREALRRQLGGAWR